MSAVAGRDTLIEAFASSNPDLRCLAMEGRFLYIFLEPGLYFNVSFFVAQKQKIIVCFYICDM